MSKKCSPRILWVLVSTLMVFSLVVSACGQAAAPTTPTTQTTPATPTSPTAPSAPAVPAAPVTEKPQQEAVTAVEEKPKYGGTFNALTTDPTGWVQGLGFNVSWHLMYNMLREGDWTKGPAGGFGSSITNFTFNYDLERLWGPGIVESWSWTVDEAKNEATIVLSIRQGIHYFDNPATQLTREMSRLVGGRELTADDVVFKLRWLIEEPRSDWVRTRHPQLGSKITKTGPWEVTIKAPGWDQVLVALRNFTGSASRIFAPEIFQRYDNYPDKWELAIGTGPFMLVDYVPGASATLKKNPNYWGTNPIGPGKGDKLPYIDALKLAIIPDFSTQQAALRTGKLDMIRGLDPDPARDMKRRSPQLKFLDFDRLFAGPGMNVVMRVDMPPFNDIRVRHAMMMATDFEAIRQGLNFGEGIIQTFPFMYKKDYKELWISHDDPELPEETRALYIYNPDKAKQLLKEAGYPGGFKTEILLINTPEQIDFVSVLKDMWQKVGVEVALMPRDNATWTAIRGNRTHPPLVTDWGLSSSGFYSAPWSIYDLNHQWNVGRVDDPVINNTIADMRRVALTDEVEAMKMMRELLRTYVLYQAYGIPRPTAPVTTFWWPWVKNYSGETIITSGQYIREAMYVWIDQELKKKMGY